MKKKKKRTGLGIKVAVLFLLIIIFGLVVFMYWQRYTATVMVEADNFWLDQNHQPTTMLNQEKGEEIAKEIDNEEEIPKVKVNPFPIPDNLAPPSDVASWTGRAPIKEGKAVQILLSIQRLLAWEDGVLLGSYLASTGKAKTPTKQGSYHVLTKLPMAYGVGDGDTWAMPNWIGFYVAGGTENGIHSLPYINGYKEGWGSLGIPVSHGCVRIADANQAWLYSWVRIGTPVIVQWNAESELRPFEN